MDPMGFFQHNTAELWSPNICSQKFSGDVEYWMAGQTKGFEAWWLLDGSCGLHHPGSWTICSNTPKFSEEFNAFGEDLHGTPNNQFFFYGCFNWMIPNHDIKDGCFTKHPLKNGGLGYQGVDFSTIHFCQGANCYSWGGGYFHSLKLQTTIK